MISPMDPNAAINAASMLLVCSNTIMPEVITAHVKTATGTAINADMIVLTSRLPMKDIMRYSLSSSLLAGVFLAAGFLAGVFLAGVFLAAGFLAAGFLAVLCLP